MPSSCFRPLMIASIHNENNVLKKIVYDLYYGNEFELYSIVFLRNWSFKG